MTGAVDGDASGAPKFHVDRSHYGAALAAWFSRRRSDVRNIAVTDIDIPVATGFSNETVFFTVSWEGADGAGRRRLVARIEPSDGGMFPVQTPAAAVSVGLQHRVMKTVAEHGAPHDVPIPPLLGYEPDVGVLGRPFFVMGFVDGVIPADSPRYTEAGFLVDEATPTERRRMVEAGIEAMAGIHAIDWKAAGLGWLDRTGTGAPTQGDQIELYRRYARAELAGRQHPVLAAALDWLVDHDPGDERLGLSWGDARLGNIIWQDYRPAAVVDWEASAISATEADVGWWLMFDRMSFDDMGIDRLDGFPTRAQMVAHYESTAGREVRDSHYWEVFATMRFCAIFIRLGDRLTDVGILPPELNPAVGNMVTRSLAELLEIDNPTPSLIG